MSRKYQIQAGDTLSAIEKRFYGDATVFGLIAAANQLADPNKIAPGQVLSILDLPSHWDVVQVTGSDQIAKPAFWQSRSLAVCPPECDW